MAKIALHNMTGVAIGELDLNDNIFGIETNSAVVQEVVVALLANKRQGTASTKRRDEVRGGGKKPWKQKGTGQARVGSIRSPLWVGGGSIFGPKPRKYTQYLTKKKKQLALKAVLSERLRDKDIVVLDKIETDEIKTRVVIEMLRRFNAVGSILMIVNKIDNKLEKSSRNIPGIKLSSVSNMNTYDLLRHNKIIIDRESIKKIEESLDNKES